MNSRDVVRGWVRRLGEVAQAKLELQDDGVCAVGYGDGGVCVIEVPDADGPLVIYAPLLSIDGLAREALFARALALNLDGAQTAGGSIALDAEADLLVLSIARGLSTLDDTSFVTLVAAIIATAVRLRSELSDTAAPAPSPSPTHAPLHAPTDHRMRADLRV